MEEPLVLAVLQLDRTGQEMCRRTINGTAMDLEKHASPYIRNMLDHWAYTLFKRDIIRNLNHPLHLKAIDEEAMKNTLRNMWTGNRWYEGVPSAQRPQETQGADPGQPQRNNGGETKKEEDVEGEELKENGNAVKAEGEEGKPALKLNERNGPENLSTSFPIQKAMKSKKSNLHHLPVCCR